MMAKLIPILLVCVLGRVWGYLEEDNWTNDQSLASYQSPTSWTWPWQGVKKGILGGQGIWSNLSPAQLSFLALVSSRGRQFKKVFSCKAVLDSPMVQNPSSHLHFSSSLNLKPHSRLKVGGCEINFIK